jgi:hypothetical protein
LKEVAYKRILSKIKIIVVITTCKKGHDMHKEAHKKE